MRVLGEIKHRHSALLAVAGALVILLGVATDVRAAAITPLPTPAPGVGSYGLEATKLQPPPTTTATITTPANGASFTESPITVSGLCTDGLLVQVYDNGVMVGAVMCENGSFSIQVSLFTGQNDFTTYQFDDLGQSSPIGNTVTVTYNNLSLQAFGTLVTLTSNYGRRAADPGQTLTWPLQVSGGTGPYAFSIVWGDGTDADLKSAPLAGEVQISHVYDRAGIYRVTVKVTDVNGVSAFIQLVAIANGQPAVTTPVASTKTVTIVKVTWWPVVIVVALMPLTYWLGRRSQLVSLHKKLEKEVENYKEL
jgi:hypothetical protein